MKKCIVNYHVNPNTNKKMWSCNRGLTRSTHVATATHCWRYDCPGIHIQEQPEIKECAYLNCTEPVRKVEKAKYCSLKCKSKESSRKYRLKLKKSI